MKADARGVTTINFADFGLTEKNLLDPQTGGNGALTGNNVIHFPVVGFNARVAIFTAAAASSGVLNPTLQHSDDGSTWIDLYAFPQQGASAKQVYEFRVTKPYLQLNGNIGGTSSTIKCTAVIFY